MTVAAPPTPAASAFTTARLHGILQHPQPPVGAGTVLIDPLPPRSCQMVAEASLEPIVVGED